MKLLLVDAYALIYRSYYAFIRSPRVNSKGVNTSACFGFVNTILDALHSLRPEYVAVAFDSHGNTFRHDRYPAYKANRDAQPEDISSNVPLIKQFLKSMNIMCVEKPGYEADDIVGTLAKRFASPELSVVMFTPDKDYAQLVDENIHQLRPGNTAGNAEEWDIEMVNRHFGLQNPSQVRDMLALWGDASDNIPGCAGVGEKRAKELLNAYGSVDGIYASIDTIKGKLKDNLLEHKDDVYLSQWLATINIESPIEAELDDMKFREPDYNAVQQLMSELEMRTVMPRVNKLFGVAEKPQMVQGDLFSAAGISFPGEQEPDAEKAAPAAPVVLKRAADTPHNYVVCQTDDELEKLADILAQAEAFCFDTETTSLNPLDCEIVGFSCAVKEFEAFYVPFSGDRDEAVHKLGYLKPYLEGGKLKIGQNLKYDILVLSNYGVNVDGPMFDTMIAHFLLFPGQPHNMDHIAEVMLGYETIHIDSLIGKGTGCQTMKEVALDRIKEYAAEDADVTLRMYNALKPLLEADEAQLKLFNEIEMPLMPVLAQMELNGVRIDTAALDVFASHLKQQIDETEKQIYSYAGEEFNISSPRQVGTVLFEKLKLDPTARKGKNGNYHTGEDVLQKIASKHPIVNCILDYRGYVKLLNTYAEALPKLVNPRTGRIHTSFNQTVVVTGRLSSTNPNLQNIPIRTQSGKEIRRAFVAKDADHVILAADYSQVELRIMAHLCQDEHLCAAFRNGEDIHASTAARINKVDISEVTKDMRRDAKSANFGIIYGISAVGLAEQLGVSRHDAKELIDGYFQSFPAVRRYMDESIAKARQDGQVSTIFGRVRKLEDINSRNGVVRGVAERNAINAPIQGSAADIIKIAMVRIHKALKEQNMQSRMLLQVHDELVFDCPRDEVERLSALVKEQMEGACSLSVPLTAEVGVGENWVDAH